MMLRSELFRHFDPVAYGFQTADPVRARFDFEVLAGDHELINLFSNVRIHSRQAVSFNDARMWRIDTLRERRAEMLNIDQEPQP